METRKKRIWSVADFAAHAGISHRTARRLLLKLDDELGGRLLERSRGNQRGYSFAWAKLRRARPELFEPADAVEFRIEELEEEVTTLRAELRRLGAQLGENTRGFCRLSEIVLKGRNAKIA